MDARVKEIEERCEKATPGPWVWTSPSESCPGEGWTISRWENGMIGREVVVQYWLRNKEAYSNQTFIAHAREDIPFLISTVRKLTSDRRELVEALTATMKSICYEDAESAEEGEYGLPPDVCQRNFTALARAKGE